MNPKSFRTVVFPKLINRMPSNGKNSNIAPSSPNLHGQQSAVANVNSVIYINQLGDMINEKPIIGGPAINRIEKWTFKRYCALLGFDPLPVSIPEGLNLIKNDTRNISFQNDRRVDFYNTWSFVYTGSSKENAKSITINVNPSFIPYWSVPRAYQLKGEVELTDVDEVLKLGKKY